MKKKLLPNFSCKDCKHLKNSMFDQLNDDEINNIYEAKSCSFYKKGQVLFHQNTYPLGVYCINEGKVKVYKIGDDGKEQIIYIAREGNLMGYKSMIGDEKYHVAGETIEDAQICFIPKSMFMEILFRTPTLNKRLFKEVCNQLGVMTDIITNMAQKPVRERLAIVLLLLKETYRVDSNEEDPIVLNLTREDLANFVGTATETLIRLLHDFKEDNLITTNGRKIRIEDTVGLRKVASWN